VLLTAALLFGITSGIIAGMMLRGLSENLP
jgi:hypothetical protein